MLVFPSINLVSRIVFVYMQHCYARQYSTFVNNFFKFQKFSLLSNHECTPNLFVTNAKRQIHMRND